MKAKVIYRKNMTTEIIYWIGKVLRNPGSMSFSSNLLPNDEPYDAVYSASLEILVHKEIIPVITYLQTCCHSLQFPLLVKTSIDHLSFGDASKMDKLFENFRTKSVYPHHCMSILMTVFLSMFKLPARSMIWKAIHDMELSDLRLGKTMPPDILVRPGIRDSIKEITVPLELSSYSVLPFSLKEKKVWTESERSQASLCLLDHDLEGFSKLVLTMSALSCSMLSDP